MSHIPLIKSIPGLSFVLSQPTKQQTFRQKKLDSKSNG